VLIIDGRGGTSQVVDFVDLGPIGINHVVAHQLEVGTSDEMPHVLLAARVEIVETDDVVAFGYQSLAKVRADEAGSSSH
jgi:hypothetical protein